MPACRQCGKENPEGTGFCGYCATPLARAAGGDPALQEAKPAGNPASARGSAPQAKPPPKTPRPESRTSSRTTLTGAGGKGGFELIPWSELSPTQRAGRSIAAVVVLFLIFFLLRGMLRGIGGSHGTSESAPAAQGPDAPISDGDRKDGIESLCKVFQIYGLPKSDHDASEAARNAGELFKLAGNQTPERSAYILTTIVGEFRGGKLGQQDCADSGAPIPTAPQESPDDSNDGAQQNQ